MEINISTKITDRSGMDGLTRWLQDAEERAKRISGVFSNISAHASFTASRTQSRSPTSGTGGTSNPRKYGPVGAGGPSYNLNTQSGLYQWDTQVFAPVEQMLRSANQTMNETAASSGGTTNPRPRMSEFQRAFMQRVAPSTVPRYKTINPTFGQQKQWFDSLAQQMVGNSIPQNVKAEYFSTDGSKQSIQNFIAQYGHQLGAPMPTTVQTNNSGLSAEVGGALGSMAKRYLPALTIGGAAMYTASQFTQGFSSWQQNSSIMSPLAHSLSQTATDVEKFRMSVVNAGAQFGWTMQQSAQAASLFAQSFGNLSQGQVSSLVGQTAQWGFNNGVSAQQSSQLASAAARLGITSGVGSTMTNQQFLNMVTSATQQSGMMGRQAEVGAAAVGLTQQVAANNPIVQNPKGIFSFLTALGKTGIQGLQGSRGEQVASQFFSGFTSMNGMQMNLLGAAIKQATGKMPSWKELWTLSNAGPQAVIPGTHIVAGNAELNYLKSLHNTTAEESLMVAGRLVSSPQNAQTLLKKLGNNPFSTPLSTQSPVHSWHSSFDRNNIAKQQYAANQSHMGSAVAPLSTFWHWLGPGGTTAATGLGALAALHYGGRALGSVTKIGSGLFGRAASLFGGSSVDTFGSSWATSGLESVAKRIPIAGAVVGTILDKASGKSWRRSLFDNAIGGIGGVIGAGLGALVPGADLTGVSEVAGSVAGYSAGHAGANWLYSHLFGASPVSSQQHATAHATNTNQIQSRLPVSSSSGTIKQLTIDTMTINHLNVPHSSGGYPALSNGNVYAPTSADGGTNFGSLNWFQTLTQKASNFLSGGTGGAQPGYNVAGGPGGINNYLSTINAASKKYGVPSNIIAAVMATESGGHQLNANGGTLTSSAGALGIMQLEPGTAKSLGVNPYNVTQNIMGGAKYLSEMYKATGNWDSAIQAYNGGLGGVGSSATEAYLQTVLSKEKELKLHSSTVTAIGQAVGSAVHNSINNNPYVRMHLGAVTP